MMFCIAVGALVVSGFAIVFGLVVWLFGKGCDYHTIRREEGK